MKKLALRRHAYTAWAKNPIMKPPNCRKKRLSPIGKTRWWAKDAALRKVFGELNNHESGTYLQLIMVLHEIERGENGNNTSRYKALLGYK